jgi:hypothetical protein
MTDLNEAINYISDTHDLPDEMEDVVLDALSFTQTFAEVLFSLGRIESTDISADDLLQAYDDQNNELAALMVFISSLSSETPKALRAYANQYRGAENLTTGPNVGETIAAAYERVASQLETMLGTEDISNVYETVK